MPGLSGLELAGVLANFSNRPAIVFVTAHDDKAVAAFDVGAVDYLLKPIRQDRLDEAVRRVLAARTLEPEHGDNDVIPAELGGVTHLVPRDTIGWVEAEGDYARLHSASRIAPGAHPAEHPRKPLARKGFPSGAPVLPGGAASWSPDCAPAIRVCWCACAPTAHRPRSNCPSAGARPANCAIAWSATRCGT